MLSPNSTMAFKARITLGCVAAVVSSACQSVGLILQRKSHLMQQDSPYSSPYKRSMWRFGFLLFICANIFGSSIQITTLPIIILSPLQSIGLIFNTLFSTILLNEVFTKFSFIGTIFTSLGAFLLAMFGSLPEADYSLDNFIRLLQRSQFIVWTAWNIMIVLLLLLWIVISTQRYASVSLPETLDDDPELTNYSSEHVSVDELNNEEYERFEFPFVPKKTRWEQLTNSINNVSKLLLKRLKINIPSSAAKTIRGLCFGGISGILSAYSLLLAKSAIEILLIAIFDSWRGLDNPVIWLVVLTFLLLCLVQLMFLNLGLKSVSTSVLYPLVFCVYNITSIGNGLIFYDQWTILSRTQAIMIFLGTILVVFGVFALSWRLDHSDKVPPSVELNSSDDDHGLDGINISPGASRKKAKSHGSMNQIINQLASPLVNDQSQRFADRRRTNDSLGSMQWKSFLKGATSSMKNWENDPVHAIPIDPEDTQQAIDSSEYVSFGSPKASPSVHSDINKSDVSNGLGILSPLAKYSFINYPMNKPSTPEGIANGERMGTQPYDSGNTFNYSIGNNLSNERNHNERNHKDRYAELRDPQGHSLHELGSNRIDSHRAKRVLSFEQKELLDQLKRGT